MPLARRSGIAAGRCIRHERLFAGLPGRFGLATAPTGTTHLQESERHGKAAVCSVNRSLSLISREIANRQRHQGKLFGDAIRQTGQTITAGDRINNVCFSTDLISWPAESPIPRYTLQSLVCLFTVGCQAATWNQTVRFCYEEDDKCSPPLAVEVVTWRD